MTGAGCLAVRTDAANTRVATKNLFFIYFVFLVIEIAKSAPNLHNKTGPCNIPFCRLLARQGRGRLEFSRTNKARWRRRHPPALPSDSTFPGCASCGREPETGQMPPWNSYDPAGLTVHVTGVIAHTFFVHTAAADWTARFTAARTSWTL